MYINPKIKQLNVLNLKSVLKPYRILNTFVETLSHCTYAHLSLIQNDPNKSANLRRSPLSLKPPSLSDILHYYLCISQVSHNYNYNITIRSKDVPLKITLIREHFIRLYVQLYTDTIHDTRYIYNNKVLTKVMQPLEAKH